MGSTVHILHRLTGVTVAAADAENTIGMARADAITEMDGSLNRGADPVPKELRLHPKGRSIADRDIVECHGPRFSDFATGTRDGVAHARSRSFYFTSISINRNSNAFSLITLWATPALRA